MVELSKRIWDTVSIKANQDILLTGIGVYAPLTGGNTQALMCVDARPLEEPLRPLDLVTELDSMYDDSRTISIFSKVTLSLLTNELTLILLVRNHSIWSLMLGGRLCST